MRLDSHNLFTPVNKLTFMFNLDNWTIKSAQITHVESLLKQAKTDDFYQLRKARNVDRDAPDLTRDDYWEKLVGCVLTTRMRSGPGSRVDEFLAGNFPLELTEWPTDEYLGFAQETLADNGIPSKQKGRYIAENYEWFQAGGDAYLMQIGDDLGEHESENVIGQIHREVMAAHAIQPYVLGIGPKQARNFWQWLGLSQWEMPLDRRILEWIETVPETPTEIDVDQSDLGDENTYRTVMSWFQALSQEAGTLPCLLDAAIFSSMSD